MAGKPLIIPVFIPHWGCPHQCAFCNQTIIARQQETFPDKEAIRQSVETYSRYKGKREQVEIAFFGGNFLGLAPEKIIRLLDLIQPYIKKKKVNGIRFSTRPDTITRQTLDLIRSYPVSTIELGVQSMNDAVLLKAKRGHTKRDTLTAVRLLKQGRFKIGVQVMVGLPGDTDASVLDSTQQVAALTPDFARIYPLVVLKNSLMEQWYQKGWYQPMSLKKSVNLVKQMYHIFTGARVKVIRMGLQASDMMEDKSMVLAGPWHPAFGHLVFSDIVYDSVCQKVDQYQGLKKSKNLILRVHPKTESRLRGNKNYNLKKISRQYPEVGFSICLDKTIPVNQVDIQS